MGRRGIRPTGLMLAGLAILGLLFVSAVAMSGCEREDAKKPAVSSAQPAQAPKARTTPSAQSTPTPVPKVGSDQPVPQPVDAERPKRGPGAVLSFDPDTAPLLPADMTAEAYVVQYYERLMQRDYEAAWVMVPRDDQVQSVADFLALLSGYEPEGFFVTDITDVPGGQNVIALQFGADNRSFTTTWEFVDGVRGRVLKDVTYALPSGGACH